MSQDRAAGREWRPLPRGKGTPSRGGPPGSPEPPIRSVLETTIRKNGPKAWKLETFKGHPDVNFSNGSRISATHFELVRFECMRNDRARRARAVPPRVLSHPMQLPSRVCVRAGMRLSVPRCIYVCIGYTHACTTCIPVR